MPQGKLSTPLHPNRTAPGQADQGVPLSAYAAVLAQLSDGISLGESLMHVGIDSASWEAAEDAWLSRIASGDEALLEALSQHWGEALSVLRARRSEVMAEVTTGPSASLAETSLAIAVDRPALPFVQPPPGAPPPVFEEGPAPAPAASLGETRLAFVVDKPALPFARAEELLPPPAPFSTLPAFKVDSPVLPFERQGSEARVAPSMPVETVSVFRVDLKALPFAKSAAERKEPAPKALPEPRLSLEAYAAMCAEMWIYPARTAEIAVRYGLSPETKANEDAAWQGRFVDNQPLKKAWERLAIEAGERIRGRR